MNNYLFETIFTTLTAFTIFLCSLVYGLEAPVSHPGELDHNFEQSEYGHHNCCRYSSKHQQVQHVKSLLHFYHNLLSVPQLSPGVLQRGEENVQFLHSLKTLALIEI